MISPINLKAIRKKHGLKQSDLAKILNAKQNSISNYENNKTPLSIHQLNKISEYFNIPIQELLNDNINPFF